MAELQLITVELRFKTTDDPGQLADRIRESVRMIVGTEALEEFRWRGLPLEQRQTRRR
ncbi:MAG TPA: hypothetical protein VGB19_06760 [Actinomycetota bacterium]